MRVIIAVNNAREAASNEIADSPQADNPKITIATNSCKPLSATTGIGKGRI